MLSLPRHIRLDNPYIKDFGLTILFGVLSVVFSKVNFYIPGAGNSNLREIPFLIALFHLSNPVFIVGLSLFALIGAPPNVSHWIVISVHLIPLFVASRSLQFLAKKKLPDVVLGMVWMIMTVAYYLILLVPLVIISFNKGENFLESYWSVLPSIRFELIASALVTGLYLIQLEIRKTLEDSNKNLENTVDSRTLELTIANDELQRLNKELVSTNNEVKKLNENLEKMVIERTNKINDQLNQLVKYAHMNSHEVRAPLARMLGLLHLIKREDNDEQMEELLKLLYNSSTELDMVIKDMNRLLEMEVDFSRNNR